MNSSNSNLPFPAPDRRTMNRQPIDSTQSPQESPFKHFSENNCQVPNSINLSSEKSDFEKINNLNIVKQKHIEDMRKNILSFKLLSDKAMFMPSNSKSLNVNKCNVILFGPSGSGKSSFIKSLYRALYNNIYLPPEAVKKLIIKNTYENEGTLCFTRLHLKEEDKSSSGIIMCDTRGHIRMNEDEKEQFKILLTGKVKEDVKIEQRPSRNPLALWEFWKKDSELFPKEIFNANEPGIESIPHAIVFVFDGSSDDVIDPDDETFYKDLVNISKRKGYTNIHVVLTRIDLFEKMANEKNKVLPSTERSTKVNTLKDEKIEKVIDVLGVSRSDIHFIENYHSENKKENNLEIDYHLLKTLGDITNACEMFILSYLNKNETCFGCFNN